MKKTFIFIGILFLLVGCGKYSKEDVINKFEKNVNNSNSYHITGKLDLYRNEELYTYIVDSSYKKEDYFRVSLINQTNNHEQIILKNKDGVFVLARKSLKYKYI